MSVIPNVTAFKTFLSQTNSAHAKYLSETFLKGLYRKIFLKFVLKYPFLNIPTDYYLWSGHKVFENSGRIQTWRLG